MKAKLVFVLYAILLTSVKCIKVVDDANENNSTTVETVTNDTKNESVNNATESDVKESRIINDNDDKLPEFKVTTPTNIHKIPPTLQNVKKVEIPVKEKPEKSLKDYANPTPAPIQNQNSLPEGKLKQAIIHSKQQSFKNLINKSEKLKDQIARPAELNTDIAVQSPPPRSTTTEFVPSPELSHLYTPDNHIQDHFHPMNQYYRPPLKQDAHFPQESPFHLPPQVDTKWLGASRSPNDNLNPNDVNPHFLKQFGMLRNTQIEIPHHHVDRQVHFQNTPDFQNQHQQHYFNNHHFINNFNNHGNSGERMVFPSEASPFNEEIKTTPNIPSWPPKIPELNKNEHMKGSWKWIPESEDESPAFQPETKFHTFHTPPNFYESHKQQVVKDRPYSFESTDIFSQHTTPPTGPSSTWTSSIGTAEALVSDEYTTSKEHEAVEKGKLDIKLLRSPSSWKRFFHVMTAAIPIGLIISALTPRIVYIHPNATAPTLQPSFSQQPFSPPPNIPPSSPQQPNAQFQQIGPNSPFPLRQRAINGNYYNDHDVNASLVEFMKFMESKYREKHGKIDSTCEDRFFCELTLMGADPEAELMYRTLYKVAIETPKAQAEKSGLKEIFTAIKRHNCGALKCKRT